LLEFEAVEIGHLDIEDQAGRAVVGRAGEVGFGRGERLCGQLGGAEKARETAPDGFVVVHNANNGIVRWSGCGGQFQRHALNCAHALRVGQAMPSDFSPMEVLGLTAQVCGTSHTLHQ